MLSLLNKGYYISPSKVDMKKDKIAPYKEEQLKTLIQTGKYLNRYHFECIFKGSGISNPFPSRKHLGSSHGASIIHRVNEKSPKKKNFNYYPKLPNNIQRNERSPKQNEEEYIEYEEGFNSNQNNPLKGSPPTRNKYNQPMALNAPGRITSHKDSEDSVGNALRRHKESGTQRKRSNYWANQSLSSSFNAESAQSRKLHNSPNSFSEDPQLGYSRNLFNPDREVPKEFHDAATVIQREYREYMRKKAQRSNFISFGGDSNLGKSFEAEKSNDIGGTSGRFYESHGLKELSQEIAKQKGEFMKQALNSGEGKNQDGLYEQAVERLMSLRALIEREYPKIKDIRKKVADVKYYFDLGQNLIDEYTRKESFSPEIYDLILAYNETFKTAHTELDNISLELIKEMDNLGEQTTIDFNAMSKSPKDELLKPFEKTQIYSSKNNCLDIIKELWGYMRDMSQNLLSWQEEHRKTESRVRMLERDNFEKDVQRNRDRDMQRQHAPPAEYMETQASELETEENKENIRKEDRDQTMEEMDLDQQLEYEMLRSQKLKQNLIEVLETYDHVSSLRRSTGRYFSSRKSPIDSSTIMRDSKGSKKESFGAESRGSNHYTYTSSLGRIEEVKNQGSADAWTESVKDTNQIGNKWYNSKGEKINIYPEYPEEVEISPRDSLARDFEDGVEIKQEKGHNKEYVIKRPTRSFGQETSSSPLGNVTRQESFNPSEQNHSTEDNSNIKVSPRFGEDQMMQNTTKKHWPNFDQLKKELDDISYKGNKTTGFGSEGRYAKPGSNSLPWKKTP